MKLDVQKRIAANILKCSPNRVWLNPEYLDEIKESITRQDIRALINQGLIALKPENNTSRGRARKTLVQKRKGRKKGKGSVKTKTNARVRTKTLWMNKIRLQRAFLKELKEKKLIALKTYQDLYRKSQGGFFRSKRHIKIYIDDNKLGLKK